MSRFLEQNEAALRDRRYLFELYSAEQQKELHGVRVELSKAGLPTLHVEGEEEASGLLYSRYQPLVEAERWAAAQVAAQQATPKAYLIFGLGLGYHVRALRDLIGLEVPVYIHEPSWAVFRTAMEETDLSDLLTDLKVYLTVGEEVRLNARSAAHFIGQQFFNTAWLEWPATGRLFPQALHQYSEETRVAAKDMRIEQNTILFFQKEWPRNLLYNLNKILVNPGLNKLRGLWDGRPAIIVSAGPSLSKNVDLLHELKGKAAILCVDTAYRVLQQKGIRPDLIFALDGSEKNYRHFTGVKPEGVPLVFLPEVHHKIVEEYGQRTFTTNVLNPLVHEAVKPMEPKGMVSYTGSVASLAFETACLMGADPVIFIGQDLAYPGGQAYAQGTMFETMTKSKGDSKQMMEVEGIDGNPVLTDISLDKFRRYFEERIEQMDGERQFIDATEGGAKIAGTEIMTLRETMERFCREAEDLDSLIDEAAQPTLEDLEPSRVALRKMRRTLSQIARLNRIAIGKNRELKDLYKVKRLRPGKVAAANADLDRIEQNIKRLNSDQWLDATMQSLLLVITNGRLADAPDHETEYAKAMRITENAELLYIGMREAAEEIIDHINVALERIGEETKLGETVR